MRALLSYSLFTLVILTGAAGAASAQTPATAPDTLTPSRTGRGFVDFGARGTSVDGDAARYERYRDMSDGVFLETGTWTRNWKSSLFDFRAEHVGRTDQRYNGAFIQPGRVKAWMMWDQIPMLMSGTTKTLFTSASPSFCQSTTRFRHRQAVRRQSTACSPPTAVFELLGAASFESGVEYLATESFVVQGTARHTMRKGAIPHGGSFGHSSLVEMPAPVLHH